MRFTFTTVCLALLAVAALAQDEPKDLTDTLNAQENLTEFTTLLTKQYGDVYANLSFQDQVTILAPSNAAFTKIPYSSLRIPFENNQSNVVRTVLQYHILPGIHRAESYNGSFSFNPTWMSNIAYTNVSGGQVVGGVQQAGNVNVYTSGMGSRSTVAQGNIEFSGGLIHVIDTFLVPPEDFITTAAQFNLTAAAGAVTNASLSEYLDTATDLTIFVPNNDAFQKLGTAFVDMPMSELATILDYHIVNGSNFVGYSSNLLNGTTLQSRQGANLSITFASNSLFVNSARILQGDILISNGIMHVIDNVLDYNATNVKPVPAIETQPAVIQGEALSGNVIPFSSYLPTTVSSFASGTPSAGASSFGVTDIGSGATSTTSRRTSSTTSGGAARTATSKAVGDKVFVPGPEIGGFLGAILLGAGFL